MSTKAFALLLTVLPACAGLQPCPAKGGPVWRTLESDHFQLSTDLRAESAFEAVTKLETLREALLAGVFPGAPARPTGRIPVVVVADQDGDWREYFDDVDAIFARQLWQPVIMMRGPTPHQSSLRLPIDDDVLVKAALVLYLTRFYVPVQSRWLAQGVASYYETLSYDTTARTITFGRPSVERMPWIHAEHDLPLEAVLDDANPGWRDQLWRFTNTSWLLVHYLMNRRPEALRGYQRLLQSATPASAWQQTFGDRSALPALALEVERYVGGGKFQVATAPFKPPVVSPLVRTERDAEVHLERALLYAQGHQRDKDASALRKARENADEALRQEPLYPAALLAKQALLEAPVPEATARASTSANPGDWRAWMTLALVLERTSPEQSKFARARAESLAADDPTVDLE